MRAHAVFLACALAMFTPRSGVAADAGTGAPACTESIPQGAEAPTLVEKVATHAKAGELVTLSIAVRHGAGEEATLPADLPALVQALPDAKGEVQIANARDWGRGAAPRAVPDANDPKHATTLLEIPFVILSTSIPRATFTLPSIRVIVLRKGGGDLAVCTSPHEISIDQPIANTPDPWPRPNPPSVPQVTRDERLQDIVEWSAAALLAGAALTALFVWWRRRPKAIPTPPPAPSPWSVAIKEIHAARDAYISSKLATKPFYDRVSDAVRVYLGRVYGFDGIDMTTDETLSRLKRLIVPVPIGEVSDFLGACDLVKFAGVQPPLEAGTRAAEMALGIVRATSPHGQGGMTLRQREELAAMRSGSGLRPEAAAPSSGAVAPPRAAVDLRPAAVDLPDEAAAPPREAIEPFNDTTTLPRDAIESPPLAVTPFREAVEERDEAAGLPHEAGSKPGETARLPSESGQTATTATKPSESAADPTGETKKDEGGS